MLFTILTTDLAFLNYKILHVELYLIGLIFSVLFGVEKYFVLKNSPTSQINRFWSLVNPFDNILCKKQILGLIWVEGSMDQFITTNLEFLKGHFKKRLISNKTDSSHQIDLFV